MKWRSALCALVASLALAATASAQQTTGSVSGAVLDQTGAVLQGVTVRISGDNLPAGRTTTTSDAGLYNFPLLIPGKYTVEAEKTGLGKATRPVEVLLGKDTQADITIGVTGVQEQVTVTAASSVVDTKSTEVAFNYQRDFLETIPLERSYRGLFQLIPGVAENRSTVGPAAGGSRQDNTYLIDGVNITNPGFGYLSTEVNELDIQEVNIKRAGVSAEFGRTAGAVTNAISRSGTNRLSGAARIDWQPQGLIGGFENSAFRDPLLTTVMTPAASMGGPLVRDKLFWYGSARYFEETRWDRINKLGDPLPDEKRTGHELYGKLTASPTTSHLFNVSYRDRPNSVDNAGLGSGTQASVANTSDNSSRVATASWGFFMTDRTFLDVKYLYMKENNEEVPVTDLGYLPSPFNPNNLASMGQYDDPALANVTTGGYQYFNNQNYRRHEVKATFSRFFDTGSLNHELKVGGGYEFGEEILQRTANGWGTMVRVTSSGIPVIRARYYENQPEQRGQGKTWSLFLQDNISITQRATVNAGLLVNRDEFAQNLEGSNGCPSTVTLKGGAAVYDSNGDTCTFLRFGFADELQPRLGITYNIRKGAGDKAYANWGRYYNMDQKSSGRSLAPSRIYQTQTLFRLDGSVLSSGPLASTTGKMIDPDIKPIYSDEVLFGYATPFGNGNMSLDVFFMYRNVGRFIEDVPSRLPDSGPYAAANLPCSRFESCQAADAKRTYKAFTIELSRRLANRWSGTVSYTWSRFEGNFDIDYSGGAVFNTSSFIQDGPGTNVQEPNRFGPLRQDRPNVFKIFTSWMPIDNLTLGAYLRSQSGAPWNARGRDWEGAVLNYLEPAGAHRNPVWTNFDFLAAYTLPIQGRAKVTVETRLLNLFGNQTVLSTDGQQYLDLKTIAVPPYFAPYTDPNPFFGTPNQYAPPRRLVLAAKVTF
ncbi:MAG: TonB-dependent receptor [Acidobacteriota bacterium]